MKPFYLFLPLALISFFIGNQIGGVMIFSAEFTAAVGQSNALNNQILIGQANFEIEYKIPSYFPEYLKHPQKIFSGREIKIIKKNVGALKENELSSVQLSKRDKNTKLLVSSKKLEIKLAKNKEPFITLPLDTATGYYTLDFQSDGNQYLLPIEINGLTQAEINQSTTNQSVSSQDNSILSIKRLNCGYCYWESVIGINPNDENWGYLIGSDGKLVQTNDAWLTNQMFDINQLTNPSVKKYTGDPKFSFTSDDKLVISSLFIEPRPGGTGQYLITGGVYSDSAPRNLPPQLTQVILQDVPTNLGPDDWLFVDYEKMAIDQDSSSPHFNNTYFFTHFLWFDDPDIYGNHYAPGVFIIRDSVITKKRLGYLNEFVPQSALVGNGGIVYVGEEGGTNIFDGGPVTVSYSLDGGQSYTKSIISPEIPELQRNYCGEAKTSNLNNRAWNIYAGPELAVDKQGRLYAVWSREKECIDDINFEVPRYGKDFDVFVSYSDDHAVTWSQPVKVNDDNSGGDQGFANIKVDDNGVVYVAFLDHRANQDQAQYDVYLAKSTDRGLSFSTNIKINDISIPNVFGWRDPGDYLDMLAVGQTKIFISHPCVNLNYPQDGRSSDACVTIINKLSNSLPTLTPTSPTATANWLVGSMQIVTWASANVPATNQINLQLKSSNAPTNSVNISLHKGPNDGSQIVTVPVVPSGNYFVELSTGPVNGVAVPVATSSVFTITAPPPPTNPTIKVIVPTNGVRWMTTATLVYNKTVTWSTTNIPSDTPIQMRLFTEVGMEIPENQSKLRLNQGINDGFRKINISSAVPPGRYYLELDTADVNGVNVTPARSGVFTLYSSL
ncbi:MAG: sialidase family protein [Patescibacteria group bacterium]